MDTHKELLSVQPGTYPVHAAFISEPHIGLPDILQDWESAQVSISIDPIEERKIAGDAAFIWIKTVGETLFLEEILDLHAKKNPQEKVIARKNEVIAVPRQSLVRSDVRRA